jgi:putative ABC transport system ATP-binding protein
MLNLRNIYKYYTLGKTQLAILKDINLEIKKGELIAIMGPSGSGKSTLMNIIGLLDKPSRGHYWLENKEITSYSDNELAAVRNQKIGFVFQSFHLLPRLTAVNNVGYPLIYRRWARKEIQRRAMDMLEKVGMAQRAKHHPNELSGGQQQRVAIARALVGQPSLILADEPTGALDSQISQDIMNLFIELNQTQGITIVIITHDPHVAEQCQRQLIIKDGMVNSCF